MLVEVSEGCRCGGASRARRWVDAVVGLALVMAGWTGAGTGGTDVALAEGSAPTTGLQDDGSAAVSWSGKRSVQRVDGAYGGSLTVLAGEGSATFKFSGEGAGWVARTGPFDGRADVYVDGRRRGRVDLYAPTKSYQQTVYRVTGLSKGKHTLRVVWTGTKDRRSEGRNVTVDAFTLLDNRPPSAPRNLVVEAEGTSARIRWDAAPEDDVAGYRVIRSSGTGSERVVVGTTGPEGRQLVDVGLPTGVRHTFSVQAFDTSGNASPSSVPVSSTLPAPTPTSTPRYATCPAATATVGDVTALTSALREARPGSVIRLLPGRYPGQVNVSVRGTADDPVWICGPRSAVLDGGGVTRNGGIRVEGSTHLVVAGMTVRNSQKGVSVLASSSVVLADLSVTDIGEEAVHLKFGTTDSTVVGTEIARTGLATPAYGEGIYVGTDRGNWCAFLSCAPDRSDRNRLEENTISRTAAEPIEVKEGTTGGLVSGNRIDGSGSTVGRLIALKGTAWTVSGNVGDAGTDGGLDGVQVLQHVGYGLDNVVFDNTFGGRLTGYGVRVPSGDTTTLVGCDIRVPAGARGVANVPCQP